MSEYPWVFDPVTWGLSNNERTILERLWEASPCVIPRDVLISAIYSDQGKRECENADAVLKIVICHLRQKSRGYFTISTHYGQGYALKKEKREPLLAELCLENWNSMSDAVKHKAMAQAVEIING